MHLAGSSAEQSRPFKKSAEQVLGLCRGVAAGQLPQRGVGRGRRRAAGLRPAAPSLLEIAPQRILHELPGRDRVGHVFVQDSDGQRVVLADAVVDRADQRQRVRKLRPASIEKLAKSPSQD